MQTITLIRDMYLSYISNYDNLITEITILKWGKHPNRYLSEEDKQMGNKHRKRCSVSLTTRETQTNTVRYQFIHLTMASFTHLKKQHMLMMI